MLTVLIVEDAVSIRDVLRPMLSRIEGVRVVGEAATAPEAEAAFHALNPDVVTLDIRLPKGNGIDVLRTIKKNRPDCAVIMLTGYPESEYRNACRELGADFFFDKATQFQEVLDVVSQLARQNIHDQK